MQFQTVKVALKIISMKKENHLNFTFYFFPKNMPSKYKLPILEGYLASI